MAKIKVARPEREEETVEVSTNGITVGRHPNCDVVFADPTVSRQHARIFREDGVHFLEDLGSQHGTRVNERVVKEPIRLSHDDLIEIQDFSLRFLDLEDDADHFVTLDDIQTTVLDGSETKKFFRDSDYRLDALLAVIEQLGRSFDLNELLPKLLQSLLQIFKPADQGFILLPNQSGSIDENGANEQKIFGAKARKTDTHKSRISRDVVRRTLREGRPLISETFSPEDSKPRSAISVPLKGSDGSALGIIHLESTCSDVRFDQSDLEVLSNVANLVGRIVEFVQLHEKKMQFGKQQRDIQTARKVQLHFLPQHRPTVAGYNIYHHYQAAEAVGGDYFDYIPLPHNRMAITMGDVSGKGVSAALLMARCCSEVRYSLATSESLSEAVNRLNRVMHEISGDRFVTFLVCVLDPLANRVQVINAGHLPPWIRSSIDGNATRLEREPSGPPLGVLPDFIYREQVCTLDPGDQILMFTDGLNEADNSSGEQFGYDRIQENFSKSTDAMMTIKTMLEAIGKFSDGGLASDDICLICMESTGDDLSNNTLTTSVHY